MRRKQLHIVLVIGCLLIFTGCSQNNDVVESKLYPIQFGATKEKENIEPEKNSAKSRANTDYYIDGKEKVTFSQGQQLGVFAMHHGDIPWNGHQSHTPNFMFNQPLTVGEPTDNARTVNVSYSPLRYWTNETDYFSFYCYYPWNDMTVVSPTHGINFDYSSEELQAKGLKFVVKDRPEDQIDFMVGDAIINVRQIDLKSTNGQIKLRLHHALAMVLFNVECSVGDLTIVSAQLSGVYNTGYCLASKDEGGRDLIQWTIEGNTVEYDLKDYIEERLANNEERYLLLIPQSVTENMVFTVSYRVDGGALLNKTYNLNNSVNITEWLSGKFYTYNINLSAE
jgi:hypothetical protein